MKITLVAQQLFDGQQWYVDQPITFVDGRVHSFDTLDGVPVQHVNGLLAPGLVDLQVNGGGGCLFNQAPTIGSIDTVLKAHARCGTTSLLPTVISSQPEIADAMADAVATWRATGRKGVIGLHFEGPHLASDKRGIHAQEVLRPLATADVARYSRTDLGQVLVTVAPEQLDLTLARQLVAQHVKLSLGHSNASYAQVQAALGAGASSFTHFGNAMSPLTAREPGMVGAALEHDDSWCGLILDGHHVHPAVARLAQRLKPRGKLMLVSDAMWAPGAPDGDYQFDGHQIQLRGQQLLSHTGQLAGAAISLLDAVNNAVRWLGVDVAEAWRMASLYPAQFLGRSHEVGQLCIGAQADAVLVTPPSGGSMRVVNTWLQGQPLLSLDEMRYE